MGKKVIGILLVLVLLVPLGVYAETTQSDQYLIISNESVNSSQSQYTGSFQIKGKKKTYQIDAKKPFDVLKNKNNKIRKSTYSISSSYQQGDSKSFWVTDFTTYSDYQINGKLLYSGTRVDVWVANNQISAQDAAKLGQEFDQNIRPIMEQSFGYESDVDGNGKINILCYDIKDGFNGSGGYIGGYFYGGDLFNQLHSNHSEVFYIDTYPLMGGGTTRDVTASYDTLVHEFQHMVNFNRNVFIEGSYTQMDVWLDEALSMAAEQIYTGRVLSDRIDYYNYSSSITNGHSLLNWNSDELANYSLSYLFGQYLKVQSNQENKIFKEIINSPYNDYRAVQSVVKNYINPTMTFGQFMTTFRGALLLKQASGLYGFKGDPAFNTLQPKLYSGSSTSLDGGGAVVKKINPGESVTLPTNKGSNVTYTILSTNGEKTVLGVPTSPRAVASSYNSVKLTWTAASGASGYEIYRSTSSSGTYTKIGTTTGTSYTSTALNTGTTYYYKIRAYSKAGTSTIYSGFTPGVSAKPVLATPVTVKAASSSYNSIKTSWSAVSGASGYEVYRATSSSGTYSLVGTTTSTSFTNGSLSTNKTYYYKVRAYRTVGAKKVYSNYSSVVNSKPVPSVPANFAVSRASSTSLKATWGSVAGASGYELYRATSSTGTYSLVKGTTTLYYTNSKLTTGKTYYFKVRAYRMVGTTKVYSGWTAIKSGRP
jgi:fibronectin type 3 domain-containing protein